MNANLIPFIVLGIALVLAVITVAIIRKVVARREDDILHVIGGSDSVARQLDIAHKLDVIDKWGKLLTALMIVYVLAIAGVLVYEHWVAASSLAGM